MIATDFAFYSMTAVDIPGVDITLEHVETIKQIIMVHHV